MFLSFRTCRVRRLKLQAADKNVSPFWLERGGAVDVSSRWIRTGSIATTLAPRKMPGSGKTYLWSSGEQYLDWPWSGSEHSEQCSNPNSNTMFEVRFSYIIEPEPEWRFRFDGLAEHEHCVRTWTFCDDLSTSVFVFVFYVYINYKYFFTRAGDQCPVPLQYMMYQCLCVLIHCMGTIFVLYKVQINWKWVK